MRIELADCVVRCYGTDDEASLARYANDREVWRNLRDGFPHPYTREDAASFIGQALAMDPETFFCIEVQGEAAGGIGYHLLEDVHRHTAEMGYWLARSYWGRGIATEAVRAVTAHAVQAHGLHRVFATPYAWNPASCRVLEKTGYVLEGRMRAAAFKDGQVVDQLLYAYVPGGP